MAIGPAITLLRKMAETGALKPRIRELEKAVRTPLLARKIDETERWTAIQSLYDATLLLRTEQQGRLSPELKRKYISGLWKEFKRMKPTLNESATRAEVVALGIGLRELALNLDDQVGSFQQAAEREIREFKSKTEEERRHLIAMRECYEKAFEENLRLFRQQNASIAGVYQRQERSLHWLKITVAVLGSLVAFLLFQRLA